MPETSVIGVGRLNTENGILSSSPPLEINRAVLQAFIELGRVGWSDMSK